MRTSASTMIQMMSRKLNPMMKVLRPRIEHWKNGRVGAGRAWRGGLCLSPKGCFCWIRALPVSFRRCPATPQHGQEVEGSTGQALAFSWVEAAPRGRGRGRHKLTFFLHSQSSPTRKFSASRPRILRSCLAAWRLSSETGPHSSLADLSWPLPQSSTLAWALLPLGESTYVCAHQRVPAMCQV